MPVVGFNFNKINVEKTGSIKGKINIGNDIAIKDVKERDLAFAGDKQKGVDFVFEFNAKYEPKAGHISLRGDVLFIDTAEKVKPILDSWKKNKQVPKDVMTSILNVALTKCNIQALILSQEINLPPPIPLPKVGVKKT